MDLPVHVAAGAATASVLLYVESKHNRDRCELAYMVKLGMACFLWGVLGHLFLDALPHYDWLFFGLPFFDVFPIPWMHPQILVTVPVLMLSYLLMKDYWPILTAAIFGGVYPDIEKLIYFGLKSFDVNWVKSVVLFPWHSLYLSGRPWEYAHKHFLITAQNVLFFALLFGILWLNEHRKHRKNCFIPPLTKSVLKRIMRWHLWGPHAARSESVENVEFFG